MTDTCDRNVSHLHSFAFTSSDRLNIATALTEWAPTISPSDSCHRSVWELVIFAEEWQLLKKVYLCTSLRHIGRGGKAPFILKLGTRWCWVVRFRTRLFLFCRKIPQRRLNRRLTEPMHLYGRFGKDKTSVAPDGNRKTNSGCPARSVVVCRARCLGLWRTVQFQKSYRGKFGIFKGGKTCVVLGRH